MREEEKRNREELFRLMKEHPDMPVVPMVDYDVVADDCCSRWMGSWGKARVGKYYLGEERVFFDDDDEDEYLPAYKGLDWYEDATDEEIAAEIKRFPWKKAIIVNIDLPNE